MSSAILGGHAAPLRAPKGTCVRRQCMREVGSLSLFTALRSRPSACMIPPCRGGGGMSSLCVRCQSVPSSWGPLAAAASPQFARVQVGLMCAWVCVFGWKMCRLQYSTVQYSTVQYSTVQYSTVQYSTVQYSMYVIVQNSTRKYRTLHRGIDMHPLYDHVQQPAAHTHTSVDTQPGFRGAPA